MNVSYWGEKVYFYASHKKESGNYFSACPSCLIMFHMKSGMASCNFFYIVNPVQCIEAYDTCVGAFAQYEIL